MRPISIPTIGGLGIDLRKTPIRTPTFLDLCGRQHASGATARVPGQSCVVVDPSARLETSYTRTGRPRGAPVGAVTTERSLRGCSRTLPAGCGVNDRSTGEGFGRKTRGQATEE